MKCSLRVITLITVTLTLVLSGCGASSPGSEMAIESSASITQSGQSEKIIARTTEPGQNQNSEAMATVQTEPLTPKETAEQSLLSTEPTEFALEKTTRPSMERDAISYVGVDGFFVPLSYIVEGHQLLTGDIGSYSIALEKLFSETPSAESLTQIEAPEGSGLGPIASNGTWNFFPDTVQYNTYEPDSQPDKQEWTQYFEEKLAAMGYDGPVLIRQSASFQGASTEIAVVTASNVTASGTWDLLESSVIHQTERPANKQPGVYVLMALFVQGQETLEVYRQYEEVSPSLGSDYLPWTQDTSFMQTLSALQFDSEGNVTEYPIYMDMTGEARLRIMGTQPVFLIADINGDNASELIVCTNAVNSLMSWCKVFTFTSGSAEEYLHILLN